MTLLAGVIIALGLHAELSFDGNKKYCIVCETWKNGSLALGRFHDSPAYVYYDNSGINTADNWWYIRQDGAGYTIANAQSGEFLTYRDERVDGVIKGLGLSTEVTGDECRWTFSESDGTYSIVNVGDNNQWINVRTDGTNLVGTYASHGSWSANEHFRFYDENGNEVGGNDGNGGGNGGETPDKPSGTWGVTPQGEYWENTGLAQPVVFTTNDNDPVLYSIKNTKSNQWISIQYTYLYQNYDEGVKFYFKQSSSGISVHLEGGYFVATYFPSTYIPLCLESGYPNTTNGYWEMGYSNVSPGYYLKKKSHAYDDLEGYDYWNNYNNNHIGLWKELDPGCSFVFYSSDVRHLEHLAQNGIQIEPVTPQGSIMAFVDSIRINHKDVTYDLDTRNFLCSVPPYLRGGNDFTTNISWKSKNGGNYALTIDDIAPDTETGAITIPAVSGTKDYRLIVKDEAGEEVGSATLNFTFLPIVEINVPDCNGSYYTTGSIRVTDPDYAIYDSTFIAAYKYRGATAQGYAKKSYAVKLRDADGNSVDREFFGLRNDNNWILDAMAVDKACMRNRVSTDLWNDFSVDPYYKKWEKKARTGTRGRFVEVFLNGRYHGLYCMTEKMDRKQLKLKKLVTATAANADTIHGTLFKSSDWTYETFMGHESDSKYFPKTAPNAYDNNNYSENWSGYEVKYPDYESEPIDWGPLWNAINFVATSSDTEFDSKVSKYFDRPAVDDYYLLIELILATDNHGKNAFFFNYDLQDKKIKDKMGIAPWDLDGTWGRRWDGSKNITYADQDYNAFIWAHEHGMGTLFERLGKSTYLNWNLQLAERYAELRATWFDRESLKKRFTDYAELFSESGADLREINLWTGLHTNIQSDVEYICNWIDTRIQFLDEQYGYVEPEPKPEPGPDGIINVSDAANYITARGGKGVIFIRTNRPTEISVYNASGRLVKKEKVETGVTLLDGLVPGVYVVAKKKVIVE